MAYNPGISYRGDMHLAQGMQALGQGISQGMQAAGQNREMRKRYGKILDGLGFDTDEVAGMSLGEMQGAVESQAMQFAQQRQQADLQAKQMQNEAFARQMQQMERAQAAEAGLLQQLGQYQSGVGRGVLAPEVMERYGLALENPAVAAAASEGVPLEVAQRYFGVDSAMTPLDQARTAKLRAEAERIERELAMPQTGFTQEDLGVPRPIPGVEGQFFVPTGRGGGQIIQTTDRNQMTTMQRDLDAIDRERVAMGLPPLTGEQRAEAMQEYVTRKVRGTPSEDLMSRIVAMNLAEKWGMDLDTGPADMFGGVGREEEPKPEEPKPEEPKPEEPKEKARRKFNFFDGF